MQDQNITLSHRVWYDECELITISWCELWSLIYAWNIIG